MQSHLIKKLLLLIMLMLTIKCYANSNDTTLHLNFNSGNAAPYGMASTVVTINGHKLPLLFDLGASKDSIVLFPAALKKIKVHFRGNETCSTFGISFSGKSCLQNFILAKLIIGHFVLHNVPGQFTKQIWGGNAPKKNRNAFKYGVIGMKFLEKYGVLIDYSKSLVILSKNNKMPRSYAHKKWITVPFKIAGGIMTVARINNHNPVKFIWDTGSIPSIINNKNLFGSTIKNCHAYLPYSVNCKSIITKSFSIDGKKLPNTWFMVESIPLAAPFTGLVGDNFFRNNVVYVDFKKHRISILARRSQI
ncbi:MAG TPA: retropepsin-like aspartic protease [Coxiellaceae bacterium]|nr:MAG: hypothetical protein A3E81_04065 [Gammaproteobacteria bacterium RIFCSPHIGHO2_12_FULL_36_30]HLB56070.1 retropepsin-like aspartic protease [Coxiellaceae bacterium]